MKQVFLPQSWYDPNDEPDFPFVEQDLYYQVKDQKDEAEELTFQLVQELYDECKAVDRDIVHGIIVKLCNALKIVPPELKDLKI